MSIAEELAEIGELVRSKEFREKQVAFFDKYCAEFEDTEENKLSYTAIHKEYEESVEGDLRRGVGEEKLARVCAGLEKFVETRSEEEVAEGSSVVMETIDLLTSLGDFEAFKAAMLARRREREVDAGAAKPNLSSARGSDVVEIEGVMDMIKEAVDAGKSGGWEPFSATGDGAFESEVKPTAAGGGNMWLRFGCVLDVPCWAASVMFGDFDNPEYCTWMESQGMKSIKLARDFGPGDEVYECELNMPRAVRYVMSMPPSLHLRVVQRHDWPSPGQWAYSSIPYDMEKNIAMTSIGWFKMESGVIQPIEGQSDKSRFIMISQMNMKYVPRWGMAWMFKKWVPSTFNKVTATFKRSKTYARIEAEEKEKG